MITNKRIIPDEFKDEGIDKSYDEVFALICRNIKINNKHERFVYFIDDEYVMDTTKGYRYENLTPAYDLILEKGLQGLKYTVVNDKFSKSYNGVLDNLTFLVNRVINCLRQGKCGRTTAKVEWFEALINAPAKHFEEAIQRLLFINQIFWQTDHRLTGLGAWDTFLYPYYKKDIDEGILTEEGAIAIFEDVLKILHSDYEYKSNVLLGDTGQIFVLGRSNTKGDYLCNELTYIIIKAVMNVQQSEPKVLLRVNSNMPKDLIELSLKSIVTGIGSPLLANDDVIIPKLIEFGIEPNDACEYVTSACWEPLIGGKSTSLNNMTVLNYLKALDNLLKRERLDLIHSYEELFDKYLIYLRRNLKAVKRVLEPHRFQYNPLLSVFIKGCYEKRKDVSWGGSIYHNVGITSVGMGNLVNSLNNIRNLVFEDKRYNLTDIKKAVILDFEGYEDLKNELKNKPSLYALDDEETVNLVNKITDVVAEEISSFRSYLGGKMKIGLSGSAYRDAGIGYGASIDGRITGEPFIVHISNDSNSSYTQVLNFASQIKYGKGLFNGNVVDLMVAPSFIIDNWEKFVILIETGIKIGIMELQMNVVSSDVLIAAYNEPEKFPQLIVRVWGFSSYFNDLPDDYKRILINRALKNEGKTA